MLARSTRPSFRPQRPPRFRSQRAALSLVLGLLLVPALASAAVTLRIPDDLKIAPGGDVEVSFVLTNDVAVRSFSAELRDAPDDLAMVAMSAECTSRSADGNCFGNEVAASNTIVAFVLMDVDDAIPPGDGAAMTLTLRDGDTPCVPGSPMPIALQLSNVDVADANQQEIEATVISGSVLCDDGVTPTPTATVMSATATPTVTIALPTASSTGTPTATPTVAATFTPNGMITPTPTATPIVPTVTQTVSPTVTPTPTSAGTITVTRTATSTPVIATPTPAPTVIVPLARARAIDKCQKAIKKAGASFVGKKLKALQTCSTRLTKCTQTVEPGAKRDGCIDKARLKCTSALAKVQAVDEPKLRSTVVGKCGGLVLFDDLTRASGLGYVALEDACEDELGAPPASVADVAACVAAQHHCEAERLFEARAPRAKELMRIAGVSSSMLAALTCLTDHGGDGSGIGGVTAGKAVNKCVAAIAKASTRFVTRNLKSLEKCVDLVFTCVQVKPTDGTCVTRAAAKCDAELAKIAVEEATMRAIVADRCGAAVLPFANVEAATGVGVTALDDTCDDVDVDPVDSIVRYATCLARQHECAVEDLLLFQTPRAAELFQRVGHQLASSFCP